MKRPMINATLFNVSTEDDEYLELRRHMVTEVTADELHQPAHILRDMLEEYAWNMFTDMDDDTLQQHYDALKQAEVDPDGITDMFEPTVVEDMNE